MRKPKSRSAPTLVSRRDPVFSKDHIPASEAMMHLAAIVESSDDAIVSKDLHGIITSWNKSAERIFGYTAEEIVGQPITVIIPPELLQEETMILGKIAAGERIEHFQTVRLRKDGRRIDVALTISPVKNAQGKMIGAAKIARDITQQKQAERTQAWLAAIVESSDDAIVSKDLNGIVTSWNAGAERIFGYTAKEIVGQPITTIIPPELHGDETMILGKIRAAEKIDHFQTVRLRKDGERLDISLTVSPIKDPQGKVIGAAKIARDVTQQKRLEAALHMSERLASVGRMAATVAHEINNPLEAITNFIYLAKQQPNISEKLKRYLSSADEELSRVAHITQQTLGFYRDQSKPAMLEVADLIESVLMLYQRKCKYKRLVAEKRIEPGLSLWALQGEMKQILSNLIANAIEASRVGGKIWIRARGLHDLRSGHRRVRITVADNGDGIPKKNKAKIFLPFFTSRKEVGTGLGLWITKDLVEKRGGHIRFRSSVHSPSGTVMSICLPAEQPSTPNQRIA